jgi:type IV pilus assembly protein PilC
MPSFAFVVKDSRGQEIQSSQEAKSEEAMRRNLQALGYQVISITRTKDVGAKKKKVSMFRRVKLTDLSQWCRQFATMINAGVSLIRCLTVLQEQTTNHNLRVITGDIRDEVEGGNSLSGAMQKYARTFSTLAIGLVRAGEVGGVLDESLQRLAGFMEKDVELRRKIKSAVTYPVIVIIFAVSIVAFLVTFILPKFMALYEELGVGAEKMPAITRILRDISYWCRDNVIAVILIVVGLFVAIKLIGRTRVGRRYLDLIKLKVPVFGKLWHKVALARFASTLSTLLQSGVPILQAMETVAGTVANVIIADAILDARASIREGEEIGRPLRDSGWFPPMVVQMIAIGEETGSLDSMLMKVSQFYESEVETALAQLTAALEPLLIVFLGVIVGFIVIAMFMPLVALVSELSSANEGEGKTGGGEE